MSKSEIDKIKDVASGLMGGSDPISFAITSLFI
jgi:hypothetical protein